MEHRISKENFVKDIFRGQLEIFEDGARLLPENCFWDGDTVFVPNEIIQNYPRCQISKIC